MGKKKMPVKASVSKQPKGKSTPAVAAKKQAAERSKGKSKNAGRAEPKRPNKPGVASGGAAKNASKNNKPAGGAAKPSLADEVHAALAWLKQHSTKATLDGMARYAIPSDHAYGVAMKDIKALGKSLGRNHHMAAALWDTGVYEARMLVSFVGDPERLTPAEMDRWCKQFDNWAYCDTLCFNLFDRSPHAWTKVTEWSSRRGEFEKRTAFALLWSLTVHDKRSGDEPFLQGLALIERAATDERNFVKKAVNMALRAVGKRNRALHAAAVKTAQWLAASSDATARWIGTDALRELTNSAVSKQIKKGAV